MRTLPALVAACLLSTTSSLVFAQAAPAPDKKAPAPDAGGTTEVPSEKAPAEKAPADKAATDKAPTKEAPQETAPAPDAAATAEKDSASETEPAGAEGEGAAAAEGTAAGSGAEEPATAPTEEGSAEPKKDEPAPTEGPADGKRSSASANQGVEPPQDDYEGAQDGDLVPKKKGPSDLSLGIALDLTWPLGGAADFISNASIQGLSLDLRWYAFGNIGIGVGVGLDSLSKKTSGSTVWDGATVTGTQVRELSFTPITLKGYYAWREFEKFIPYVGAGLGVARTSRRLVVGYSSLHESSWHFVMAPELGLHIPAGPTVLMLSSRLNYLTPAGGFGSQLFANLSFGLAIQ